MKKWELVVKWETGEEDRFIYDTKEAAEKAASGYKTAFGNQVTWTGIIEKWV